MARLSSRFSSMPKNANARKGIYRNARLGQRPTVVEPNMGDAMHTMTAALRYKEAYEREQATNPFIGAWAAAWANRKAWRP